MATAEPAQKLLSGKTVNFVHRSLLLAFFYAALILGSIQSSTAAFTDGLYNHEAATVAWEDMGVFEDGHDGLWYARY